MITESIGLAQVEEPVVSTGTEDSALQTSTAEPATVEFVAAPVAPKATITVLEESATTLALTKPAAGLVSAPNEWATASVAVIRTIIERGCGWPRGLPL